MRRFVYVGRKSLEKGYDVIEAAAKIVADRIPELEFIFVGPFDKGVVGNCRYEGWVQPEDLPAIFNRADAFIMTSRTEGFPQAAAEAFASGLPAILPRHIFGSMFTDGEHALLTSLDPEEIARAVCRLHEDRALADELARNSRAFAEGELNKDTWRGRYGAVLTGGGSALTKKTQIAAEA